MFNEFHFGQDFTCKIIRENACKTNYCILNIASSSQHQRTFMMRRPLQFCSQAISSHNFIRLEAHWHYCCQSESGNSILIMQSAIFRVNFYYLLKDRVLRRSLGRWQREASERTRLMFTVISFLLVGNYYIRVFVYASISTYTSTKT